MTKQSRKRTAGQRRVPLSARKARQFLLRLNDGEIKLGLRKPNFGWPFDNVNAIVLKSRC